MTVKSNGANITQQFLINQTKHTSGEHTQYKNILIRTNL